MRARDGMYCVCAVSSYNQQKFTFLLPDGMTGDGGCEG